MYGENQTSIKTVLLLGFQMLHNVKIPFFILLLILYCLTITGNAIIVAMVSSSPNLHRPMFFFLSHLSMSDIIVTTSIVPNMLHGTLKGEIILTLSACVTQFHFFSTAAASECLLLAVMSYDRYLAICKPLRYVSIMHRKLCLQLAISCWALGFIFTIELINLISRLKLCGRNVIDHFFCDLPPIVQLSCSDVSAIKLEQTVVSAPMTFFPVMFIVGTYILIFIAILRISSTSGRQKAFSTCSSHLAVVGIYYGSLISLYVVPSSESSIYAHKVLSLLFTVLTPLFNPIIYSLRNLEIKITLIKFLCTFRLRSRW